MTWSMTRSMTSIMTRSKQWGRGTATSIFFYNFSLRLYFEVSI